MLVQKLIPISHKPKTYISPLPLPFIITQPTKLTQVNPILPRSNQQNNKSPKPLYPAQILPPNENKPRKSTVAINPKLPYPQLPSYPNNYPMITPSRRCQEWSGMYAWTNRTTSRGLVTSHQSIRRSKLNGMIWKQSHG